MANEIKDKFAASTAMTITLASLASSTSGVGRQSTEIDNTTNRYQQVLVFCKLRQGTSPTGNRKAMVYLIRNDNEATPHRSDAAGASDAAWTQQNAPLVGIMVNKASPATGDDLYGEFLIDRPGPKWAIGIVHDTGVALDADAGDHWLRYVGLNPEVQ